MARRKHFIARRQSLPSIVALTRTALQILAKFALLRRHCTDNENGEGKMLMNVEIKSPIQRASRKETRDIGRKAEVNLL